MASETLFGGTTFKQTVPCHNEHVRIMVATGVLDPVTSDKGHRLFRPADVKRARAWMRENTRQRRSA